MLCAGRLDSASLATVSKEVYCIPNEFRVTGLGGQGDRPMSVDILPDEANHPQPTPP
ncbi:hypothetical protein [Candidatus Regiella insecticola]|uniref:hypothetical protein n=1 Tax=Candidatus Regiella insecticola TaxID=138073 RepID=UPI0002E7A23C|nr:hypothetical protein [Candidatus Regiella insecticola]